MKSEERLWKATIIQAILDLDSPIYRESAKDFINSEEFQITSDFAGLDSEELINKLQSRGKL
jgi:hypothetical protein